MSPTYRSFVSSCAATALIVACASDTTITPEPPDPGPNVGRALKISARPESLFYGRATTLAIQDSADVPGTPAPRTWSSSDTSVLVVDSTGTVLAVGVGAATITVKRTGASDTARINAVLMRADGGVPMASGGSGGTRVCAVAVNGGVYCRISSATDTAPLFVRKPGAAGLQFTDVQTSEDAECALSTAGAIYCWGRNDHYHMATRATLAMDSGPVAVKTALRFSSFAHGGHSQTCGVSLADSLTYCWGHNDSYQLGYDTNLRDDSIPKPVAGVGRSLSVSTHNGSTCIVALDNSAYCSGIYGLRHHQEQSQAKSMLPVQTTERFKTLSHGDLFLCGLAMDNAAVCWGSNTSGSLGNGSERDEYLYEPRRISGGLSFAKVAALNRTHACGLTVGGDLYCWGAFLPAAIRTRLGATSYSPVHIAKGVKFKDLLGPGSVCAIATDGRALCW
jgi:alpha-tubulin suppressor-like RCC1 family protein